MKIAGGGKQRKVVMFGLLFQLLVMVLFVGNNQNILAMKMKEQFLEEGCKVLVNCWIPGIAEQKQDSVVAFFLPLVEKNQLLSSAQEDTNTEYVSLAIEENEQVLEKKETISEQSQKESRESAADAQMWLALEKESEPPKQVEINRKKLTDYDYLRQNFYQVDSSTTIGKDQLNAKALLGKDMSIKKEEKGPQILIYHTHSQEGYKDSKKGDVSTGVVGVGDYLTKLLEEKYGYQVLHHKGEYDVGDRQHAYTNAAPAIEALLKKYPSIKVVIDLHRDGVGEKTRLVTTLNGKKTAQIMFFNGLSRTTAIGDIEWLPNPYIADNLAMSFQLQLAAADLFPGLTRKIYLKGYRYNMHFLPRSVLVEVGAQTNTFQEAKNAMVPLAKVLDLVLSGKNEKN